MRRIISCLLVLSMLFSFTVSTYAYYDNNNGTNASQYLSSYGISLAALSNHQMAISVDVEATHQMTRVGVFELYIEEYNETLGDWDEYEVRYGSSNLSLYYEYNSWDYVGTFYFTGTPGKDYRVTMTCLALDSTGSDTGEVTSYTRTCI